MAQPQESLRYEEQEESTVEDVGCTTEGEHQCSHEDSCESNIYLETEEKECCENKDDCKEDQSCCQKEQEEAETCCPGGICDTKEVEDKVAAL